MTPAEERNEEGKYVSEHGLTAEDVFDSMEPLEPYSTAELADDLNAPRRTVYKYLNELAEEGRITKKKPNERRVIWMRGG
jgi:predicted transcriptional regulator